MALEGPIKTRYDRTGLKAKLEIKYITKLVTKLQSLAFLKDLYSMCCHAEF